jgi:cytochrome bd-type quinol oxidase subunit 2
MRNPAAVRELATLVHRDVSKLKLDGAWELAGDLKRLNLRFADREYMTTQLEYEQRRARRDGHWHGWNAHFDKSELRDLLKDFKLPEPTLANHARAVDRLTFLYLKREEAGRDRRARAELKKLFLNVLAGLLVLLLAGFGVAANFTTGGKVWESLLLAVCAGALGSTLSGIIKVRDQLGRLEELRSFRPAMRVQPLIGACAGAILLLALRSHAVSFGSTSRGWEGIGLIAFAAGFSEPFFLGVVQRVAGSSGRQADDCRKTS